MSGGSTNQRHDRHAWRETRNYERGRLGDGESGLVEGELIEERGVDGEASEWRGGGARAQPIVAGTSRKRSWFNLQAMGCGLDMRKEFSRCEC
jgi:hypothetical protein